MPRAVPLIERQCERKGRRLNAKRKASSQATELASITISDEAGPQEPTTRPRRNAQEARNRERVGGMAANPGKRRYGPHRAEFRPSTRSPPGWPGPASSISLYGL